jgi:hypothetical protein
MATRPVLPSSFLSAPGDEEPQTARFLPFPRRRRTETSAATKRKKKGQKEAFFLSIFRGAGKPLKHLEPALGRIDNREEKKRRQNEDLGGVLGSIS